MIGILAVSVSVHRHSQVHCFRSVHSVATIIGMFIYWSCYWQYNTLMTPPDMTLWATMGPKLDPNL